MFFHNFKNPNSVPNLINLNWRTLILKLGFIDQSFHSSITEPNMHPTPLTTLIPCIWTHYRSRCRRETASHSRSRSLSRCRCAPLRHHPYLQPTTQVVATWSSSRNRFVRTIVRAVADAMVRGWRRSGGLPERPGAALGLKRESELFTVMQKHMLLVAWLSSKRMVLGLQYVWINSSHLMSSVFFFFFGGGKYQPWLGFWNDT